MPAAEQVAQAERVDALAAAGLSRRITVTGFGPGSHPAGTPSPWPPR
jgi:hypothetical protein